MVLLCIVGCEYDDSELRKANEDLKNSVSKLEQRVSSVEAVQKAYNNNLFISSITKIQDGYEIVFSDGSKATILNGTDGKDGVDGKDGENGKDGADGKDGVDGKDGETLIQSITISDNEVTFVLTDGRTFSIPLYNALSVTFDVDDTVKVGANATIKVGYTIESNIKDVTVEVISSADIKAYIEDEHALTGSIEIIVGDRVDKYSKVVVLVSNGERVVMRRLSFEKTYTLQVADNAEKRVDITGGEVTLEYLTDLECEVVIPEDAKSWLTIVPQTRAVEKYTITLSVADNSNNVPRSATVYVQSINDNLKLEYIIKQDGIVRSLAYTTNNGNPLSPYTTEGFGSNFVENIYDSTIGQGELKFGGDIKYIPEKAFISCTNLTWIDLPNTVTNISTSAFKGCSRLASITIPDKVTYIGFSAFEGCSSLTSITIPDKVTKIYYRAFYDCSSLTSVTIPDKVTEIGSSAFYGCSSLTSITIPDKVTEIGSYAFEGCSSLTSITIPDKVTEIGSSAFEGCSSLTSITIPDKVTEIGYAAFQNCSSLTSVTIPDSVTSIGNYAFKSCKSLTSVTIPDSVTSIGYSAFSYCSRLTSVTIGNSVTSIGNSAFDGCTSLTSVTIPNSVTSIGELAFYNCSSLTSVTIPESVTSIEYYAFAYCSSLTSVTIPDSVTSIGENAFNYCSSLTSVYCKPTTPPTLSYSVFDYNAADRKIYVPAAAVDAYKAATRWKNYATDIVGYDF